MTSTTDTSVNTVAEESTIGGGKSLPRWRDDSRFKLQTIKEVCETIYKGAIPPTTWNTYLKLSGATGLKILSGEQAYRLVFITYLKKTRPYVRISLNDFSEKQIIQLALDLLDKHLYSWGVEGWKISAFLKYENTLVYAESSIRRKMESQLPIGEGFREGKIYSYEQIKKTFGGPLWNLY